MAFLIGELVRMHDAGLVYRVTPSSNTEPYESSDNVGTVSFERVNEAPPGIWERVHLVPLYPQVKLLIGMRLMFLDRFLQREDLGRTEAFAARQERFALRATLQWSKGEKITWS